MSDFQILQPYAPVFYSDKTYFIISGGRGSGKSTQVAAYFLIKLLSPEFFRGVVSRYTQKSIKSSIYRDILDLAEQWNIKHLLNISGDEIQYGDNLIITHSMKLADGTMSAKGKGLARVTHLLIDEATELPSEEEFIKLNDTFRTKGAERKVFLLFNPTTKHHWIYKRFFLADGVPNPKWSVDHCFLHTTYHCNVDNLDPKKIAEWERMKDIDLDYYNHHILGRWSQGSAGRVFFNWNIDTETDFEAETIYGLDFGFSADPAACVEVKQKNNKLYLRELFYLHGMTNEDLFSALQMHSVPLDALIVADSAEPKSIETLKRLGYRNIKPAYKGPDSVRSGIQKIKAREVHVHPSSTNLLYEYDMYSWKEGTDRPVDAYNHCMDAVRYALSLEKKTGQYSTYSGSKYNKTNRSEDDSYFVT